MSTDEFWLFYLREHAKPATRALHYFGTTMVLVCFGLGLFTGRLWWFWVMPVAGYLFAWLAHFLIERNRPATFKHPIRSIVSDFRMYALWVTGGLSSELRRAGLRVPDNC